MGTARVSDGATIGGVTISNVSKVWWPEEGITKGDIARYYHAISPLLLPWMLDRPLTAERCPDGMLGGCFYRKNFPEGNIPIGAPRLRLRAASTGKDVNYVVGGTLEALLGLVRVGCISMWWGENDVIRENLACIDAALKYSRKMPRHLLLAALLAACASGPPRQLPNVQGLIKYRYSMEALKQMDYLAVGLGEYETPYRCAGIAAQALSARGGAVRKLKAHVAPIDGEGIVHAGRAPQCKHSH